MKSRGRRGSCGPAGYAPRRGCQFHAHRLHGFAGGPLDTAEVDRRAVPRRHEDTQDELAPDHDLLDVDDDQWVPGEGFEQRLRDARVVATGDGEQQALSDRADLRGRRVLAHRAVTLPGQLGVRSQQAGVPGRRPGLLELPVKHVQDVGSTLALRTGHGAAVVLPRQGDHLLELDGAVEEVAGVRWMPGRKHVTRCRSAL